MGYNDEAIEFYDVALSKNPNHNLAKKNKESALNNLQAIKEAEEASVRRPTIFWDAFGNFLDVMNKTLGTISAYQNSFSENSSTSSSNDTFSSANGENYQQQYAMWERRAQSNYESLTNLGVSVSSKNSASGTSGGGGTSIF